MTVIMDCTIRDGGYYTNWDFSSLLVEEYIKTINDLPIDYIEIGYRNKPLAGYHGEYYYLPAPTIERIKGLLRENKKLSVMINSKSFQCASELSEILEECVGKIDMIRFATDPQQFEHSLHLALEAKKMGFEVGMNLMYLSKSKDLESLIDDHVDQLKHLDVLYFVDSYGACFPEDIENLITPIVRKYNHILDFGFHGHDNAQLAFANTLKAIEANVKMIDTTVKGMGRGAGNLKTELFCMYLSSKNSDIDIDKVLKLEQLFDELYEKNKWGPSLPYMFSGLNNMPQKQVMDLLSKRRYSTSTILNMIQGQNEMPSYANKKPQLDTKINIDGIHSFVVVGGGKQVCDHLQALRTFISQDHVGIVFSSLKNAEYFYDLNVKKYLCLPGDEYKKLDNSLADISNHIDGFIVSEETEIKTDIRSRIDGEKVHVIKLFEIKDKFNEDVVLESPLHLALSFLNHIDRKLRAFLAGYDGYDMTTPSEVYLQQETQFIIDHAVNLLEDIHLTSILPTNYTIEHESIYSYLINTKKEIRV